MLYFIYHSILIDSNLVQYNKPVYYIVSNFYYFVQANKNVSFRPPALAGAEPPRPQPIIPHSSRTVSHHPHSLPLCKLTKYNSSHSLSIRDVQFSCGTLVPGLSQADCDHMASIGMNAQGINSYTPNGNIWLGNQGPNTFVFTNTGGASSVILIVWHQPSGDYSSSFMAARQPKISYSLRPGASVTVSIANGVSGGFAGLYNQATPLTQWGQIDNTWGEFTTGDWATVDVTREVNMGGNAMEIVVQGSGCVSDMSRCSFQCKSGNTCWESGSYNLVDCQSQPGAAYQLYGVDPSGGCQGFSNGGQVIVSL